MVRILIYIGLLFALAFAGAWVADRPGTVAVDWLGYHIELAVLTSLVALFAVIVGLLLIWSVLRSTLGSPAMFGRFLTRRRSERGREALSRGLIAVGAGNVRLAKRLSGDASKLLKGDPATLLLKAQTAQLEGATERARKTFETMVETPQTRLLGLRGLHIEALRAGQAEAADLYAEEAHREAPDLPWAATAVFESRCATRQWDAALTTLDAMKRAKLVDKDLAKRRRAVLLAGRALDLEDGSPDDARDLAADAQRLAPDLVPAAVISGRISSRLGDIRKATKVLETAWKQAPHPEIADAYAHVRAGDSARDRLKRIRHLITQRANHREGTLALAQAALDAQEFELARETLTPLLKSASSQRACLMMADLEESQHGDDGRVREWLARAVNAPRDPAWTADGITAVAWAPISPVSGRLDAFEWKVPVEPETPLAQSPIDDALLAAPITEGDYEGGPAEASLVEVMPPAALFQDNDPAPEETETVPDDAEIPLDEDTAVIDSEVQHSADVDVDNDDEDADLEVDADEQPSDAVGLSSDADAATDDGGEADPSDDADKTGPVSVEFPLPRPPDDPGPDTPADESEKRFKLF